MKNITISSLSYRLMLVSCLLIFIPLSICGKTQNQVLVKADSDTLPPIKLKSMSTKAQGSNNGNSYSVSIPEFPYKSPEAAAFQKYGEYAVNEYTGNPNITVPLYTVTDKDVQIPIVLNYDASGIRVDQEASWVGLGWNLMVGGCVNYVQSGQFDKYQRTGDWKDYVKLYDSTKSIMKSSNFKTYNDSDFFDFESGYLPENKTTKYVSALPDVTYGLGERDYFSVNILGKSFSFFFNPYTCSMQVIGKASENFEIKTILSNGSISSGFSVNASRHEPSQDYKGFIIKDSEGNMYSFLNTEWTYCDGISYISAWNLTKIESAGGAEIEFKYSAPTDILILPKLFENFDFVTAYPGDTRISSISYGNSQSGTGYLRKAGGGVFKITKSFLSSIETDFQKVLFGLSNDRTDCSGANRINSLKIIQDNTGKVIKNYDFNYSYFIGNNIGGDYMQVINEKLSSVSNTLRYRLKLLSVDEFSNDNRKLTTSFEYNSESLPLKTSYATDYWGYFNGNENINSERRIESQRTSLPKALYLSVSDAHFINNDRVLMFGGANRYANPSTIQAGMLTKIIYPTHGYTKFEYESNIFDNGFGLYPDQNTVAMQDRKYKGVEISNDLTATRKIELCDCNNNYHKRNYHTSDVIIFNADKIKILHAEFHSDSIHSLKDMQEDGAQIVIVSMSNGSSHCYTPKDIGSLSDNGRGEKIFKDIALSRTKGKYKIIVSVPDKYGVTTDCTTYASIESDLPTASSVAVDIAKNISSSCRFSTGGGVRIKRMSNYDISDALIDYRDYSYSLGKLLCPLSYGRGWIKGDWHKYLMRDKENNWFFR